MTVLALTPRILVALTTRLAAPGVSPREEFFELLESAIAVGHSEVALRALADLRGAEFDPDQPRDEEGQWTDGGGSLTSEILSTAAEKIRQREGLAILDLRLQKNGSIQLETIAAHKGEQGKGAGSRAMESLIELADEHQTRIELSLGEKGYQPEERGVKTTSRSRLVSFYKQFGFVENKGRHKRYDFSLYTSMYREPKRLRGASYETPLHAAADAHVARLSVALRYAFAKGRKVAVLHNVEKIVQAIRSALEDVLPATLLKVVAAGGRVGMATLGQLRAARFNPDQPRDDQGQWTEGGGFLATPSDALVSLSNGEEATIAAEDIRGLLKRAADVPLPIDLTLLTIEGTPIFAGGLNLPRSAMPQIEDDHQEPFLAMIRAKGIAVTRQSVSPLSLLPTQNEISATRVGRQLIAYDSGKRDLRPILVSQDDKVLDGHHRWATMAALDVESPKLRLRMPVIRIHAHHRVALREMLSYTKAHGIASRGLQREELYGLAFDPDQPRDDQGQWTDGGSPSAIAMDARLATESATGIVAVERLLDQAIAGATTESSAEEDEEVVGWDDVSKEDQSTVYEKWSEDYWQNEADVDTSDLDKATIEELRRDNEDVIAATEKAVAADVLKEFIDTDPTLPVEPAFVLQRSLDLDTLTYEDDEGDGAPLVDLDAVRFSNGDTLTADQQERLSRLWDENYSEKFDQAQERAFESESYNEARADLASEAMSENWNNLSENEKLSLAAKYDIELSQRAISTGPVAAPTRWMTGIDTDTPKDLDYQRTGAIARKLTELRMAEILHERGLEPGYPHSFIHETWEDWKSSSSNDASLALQLSIAKELGGVHRIPAETVARLEVDTRFGKAEMQHYQAYARAQWETTQYVMTKAGQDSVEVYRGLMLSKGNHTESYHDNLGGPSDAKNPYAYVKLPDIQLQRGGAQSTTGTLAVANMWNGVGELPSDAERVVLRVRAPRTSVFSLPVYGVNLQAEHEVVLAGTRDRWAWDAWRKRAPDVKQVPIGGATLKAQAHHKRSKTKTTRKTPLVIDLQALDQDRPHWLSKTNPLAIEWLRKRRALRTAGGPGSGNFGHAGRPGEVGGSGAGGESVASSMDALLPVIAQPDGGFTYHAVTGESPTTGFVVSTHKDRERVLHIKDVTLDSLEDYVESNQEVLSAPGNYLGGWHNPDDGMVYLDVSTVVADAQEAERLGRSAKQLAYFDLVTHQSVAIVPELRSYAQQTGVIPRRPIQGVADDRRPRRARETVDRPRSDRGRDRGRAAEAAQFTALAPTLRHTFNVASPQVVQWAKQHSAELIDDISDTSRKRVQKAIATLTEGGDWNKALDVILAAVGDDDRAELIARHETMMAASEGQRLAWDQAVESGLLTGGERRTWITIGDLACEEICQPLDGKTADLNGEYPGEGGNGPPAHIQCRCTEGLT